jgi:hypothetical protein
MQDIFMRKTAAARSRRLLALCSFVSFVVGLACVSGCTIGREPKHAGWATATGAEQYERLMWQAIRDRDWTEIEYRLAPMFVGVNPAGQSLDRAAWIQYWKATPVKDFTLAEVVVQPNGADMTVSYVLHLGNRPGAGLRVLSVWQEVKKGWMLTATSMTPVTPSTESGPAK